MACLFMLYGKKKVKKEKKVKKSNVDEENTELIFVGVEYANEDAATLYAGGISDAEPAISNIQNSQA